MLKQLLILLASATYIMAIVLPTEYTYKTVGNISIKAAVYVPNITVHEYPVVMAIHGGGYLVGGCENNAYSVQERNEMLARGWVIVSIDYRLSPYVFLPDMVADVQDAYDWIRNELVNVVPINPDAIAIWGDSAGAGLTVIAGYKLTPPPQVIISFYPYCTDFTGTYAYNPNTPVSPALVAEANSLRTPLTEYIPIPTADPRWTLFANAQHEEKGGWLFTTADPNANPQDILSELKEYSVVYNIDASYPPTYLIHGLNDTTVPYAQSVSMAHELKIQNVPYVLDLVPGVGHAFDLGGVTQQMWVQHILPVFAFTQQYITKGSSNVTSLSMQTE